MRRTLDARLGWYILLGTIPIGIFGLIFKDQIENAARAAARADLVGESPARAARSALPKSLERDLSVTRVPGDGIRVGVRLPLLLHAWHGPLTLAATASLGRGG